MDGQCRTIKLKNNIMTQKFIFLTFFLQPHSFFIVGITVVFTAVFVAAPDSVQGLSASPQTTNGAGCCGDRAAMVAW
jgi:hypothetical protein